MVIGFPQALSAGKGPGRVDPRSHWGRTPQILISTDVAIGLIDTHGGASLSPVSFNADHSPTTDVDINPQDIDDGLMLSMALKLDAAGPRNAFFRGIFGTPEGPFDQYALTAAARPELFDCRPALAYVKQCPFPAWSSAYPTDADGNPTQEPYNAPANPCFDHGPANGASLSEAAAELIVTLDLNDDGPLVRGTTGIDGNIPALVQRACPVTACIDFAGESARNQFEEFLKQWTW
jgi:hypothetical protein